VATSRPNRVIGMHFFNPAPIMKLVEIVKTVVTADEVVADIEALCERLGKVDVTITDRAGFIANALLFGYLNHAVQMYESKYATREDIDAAMRLGCGLPMGPLALMDLIGLDTAYEILDTMYRRGGRDRRHAPVPLIKQMVTAGLLGRKSGAASTRTRSRAPGRRPPTSNPAGARLPRGDARHADDRQGRRGSAPAPWPPASWRCSPRPGTSRRGRPRRDQGRPGCAKS
jgi:3-hydroxybutyryl-CoA dehydrogenase